MSKILLFFQFSCKVLWILWIHIAQPQNMETERFHSLIDKYLSGKTTAEENAKLLAMMDEEDAAHAFDEYAFVMMLIIN